MMVWSSCGVWVTHYARRPRVRISAISAEEGEEQKQTEFADAYFHLGLAKKHKMLNSY